MVENIELLKPKYYVVFRALFGDSNKSLAETFISDILGQKVEIKEILDRHLNIKVADQKLGIMDYRVVLEDNSYCNIEIQLQEHDYEIERFIYYLADTYSRQLLSGEEYVEINKTISIVILDHEIKQLENINELNVKWQMRDNKTGKRLLTDKFEMCIIELPKARRLYSNTNSDKICNWMLFLDNPNSQEVLNIMEKDKDIKKAGDKLKYLSKDEEIRRIAELKEKARRDAYAVEQFNIRKGLEKGIKEGLEKGMKEGLERGLKEGIEQGIEQEKITIAKNMMNEKIDVKVISKVTGLCEEKINLIRVENE